MRGSHSEPKTDVVLLQTHKHLAVHELAVHQVLGEKIARLLGGRFAGQYDGTLHQQASLYFIPSDTLIGVQAARELGITSLEHLFGGVVEQPFMATKAISHPLPNDRARRPQGWSSAFFEAASEAVLPGFTLFNLEEARQAGRRLLDGGPVRVKPVRATAGRGQRVVTSAEALDQALDEQDEHEVADWGLVLEEDLSDVLTFSVGQVQIAGMTVSYHGTQRLTADNQGEQVYGGSELWLVRGGFDDLLRLPLDEPVRHAVDQALCYDRAARRCLPGFFASRRNYDVALGRNAKGASCSGVLEQSWRIGGASPAEIEAMLAFAANPGLDRLCASTHEIYGQTTLPADADLLYQGDDPEVGLISKYTQVRTL